MAALCLSVKFWLHFSQSVVANNTFVSEGRQLGQCLVSCEADAGCSSCFYDKLTKKCYQHENIFQETDRSLVASSGMVYYISEEGKRCLNNPGYEFKGYGVCVKYFFDRVAWPVANDTCFGENARLVQIDEVEKNRIVVGISLSSFGSFWLGGSDIQQNGTFLWTDGTPVPGRWSPGFFHNWRSTEPDQPNWPRCMVFYNRIWGDAGCASPKPFLCEKIV